MMTVTCSENISDKKSLFISDAIRYAVQPLIGQRHAHIFCLTTVDAAAQCPAAMLQLAVVDIPALAEEAFATERLYVNGYTVTDFDITDIGANLFHNADHLVADGYSGNSLRHTAMLYMKVTRADAPERNAHDGILWVFQYRFGLVDQLKPPFLDVCICFHLSVSSL